MMLDALNLPLALQQSQQPAQPMRYATGGMVGGLPSLADLSRPDFDWSSMGSFNPAPSSFTPMTQDVPMFVARSPAYGSMGTDVYDWKAPTAMAPSLPYSTTNQEVALTDNRRVPTETAIVDIPMPGYETPTPNVPTDTYVPTMPGVTPTTPVEPPPANVFIDYSETLPDGSVVRHRNGITTVVSGPTKNVDTGGTTLGSTGGTTLGSTGGGFTPVTNPLGPDPFDARRLEAAKELEAFTKRQEELKAEEKRLADAAMARQAEEQRLADEAIARQAEEQRVADAAATQKAQEEKSGLVSQAYKDILGREADSSGLNYWMGTGESIEKIRSDIQANENQQISQAYKDILGREADAEGLAYWANSGQDMDTIRSNIQRSTEAAAPAQTPAPAAPSFGYVNPEGESGSSWYAGDSGD
jgi:hypothetical protein